jgi:4-amino-4-deoxy-L-arabinose transferase-like glycosyltransferase
MKTLRAIPRWRELLLIAGPLAAATVVALTIVGGTSVWLVLATDGLLAVALVSAAAGWGLWPARWLSRQPRRLGQQVCLAVALGLGTLSLTTLTLGVIGQLNRVTAWALVAAGGVLLLWYLARSRPGAPKATNAGPAARQPLLRGLALALLAVPLTVALLGATLPPRVLWAGENRAYDVLEYHLQAPREYFDAGRVHFLSHNVYASFPQQMEMLYLLLMHLAGNPHAAGIPAQMLHVICALLTVLALAAWTPLGRARWLAALAAGSVPWLAYLGCLAYVECGVTFFAAVAAGLLAETTDAGVPGERRTALAAGLCAGLAGGCKYTAVAMVAVALGLAWLVAQRAKVSTRLRRFAYYMFGGTLAFAPWAVRNTAWTGNPVYPFVYRWFGGTAWSAEQDAQWHRGHRVPPQFSGFAGRTRLLWSEFAASPMFGPTLLLLAIGGALRQRSRQVRLHTAWVALIILTWATLTHMPGRFVTPVIVPLGYLAALPLAQPLRQDKPAPQQTRVAAWHAMVVAVALGGVVLSDAHLVRLFHQEVRTWADVGAPLNALIGNPELLVAAEPINRAIPPGGRVWLVGEARAFYLTPHVHYTVVFSRDPWLQYAERAEPRDCVAWLRTRNVTHVVFSWAEIRRLQRTYGFPEFVTPDWVRRLESAGLRRAMLADDVALPEVDVYELTPARDPEPEQE